MGETGARRRRAVSPYSRTGLFPWGATYDVPAQLQGDRYSSQTPCHLRTVTAQRETRAAGTSQVRCPVCGRGWTVEYRPDTAPPLARWTA